MRNTTLLWILLVALGSLTACMSYAPLLSKADLQKDRGPHSAVDLEAIPDAIPQPVTRTKAGNYSPYTVFGKTYTVLAESDGFIEEGIASWYGKKFHGRLTSNGERFDMYAMTAAHKNLPIPTYVEVTNLDNGASIILRVNDRGPFHANRVIDLSWAAAAKLDFADTGTARVRVVALDAKDPLATVAEKPAAIIDTVQTKLADIPEQFRLGAESYYQVARLSQRQNAEAMALKIEAYTKYPIIINHQENNQVAGFQVLTGPLFDRREADALGMILELAGMSPGFIVRLPD